MQSKEKFEYAIIRLVPRVEREEFFNIGVLLFCKRKKFLKMKVHVDARKIACFNTPVDCEKVKSYLEGWQKVCEGGRSGGRIGEMELTDRFRWLAASRSSIIQTSMMHTGLTQDPEKTLDLLFEETVL
ncbi:Protein of unknown function [Lishizhenia tianjinensis]|uniref:DUF3037 domain-containing protein n=1 Tax=Lishizhenia tianjinensis TaxID=477690 RepID=A0A1I6YKV7_9FLAO|nr:DUF3037 domain-containing protein [Lishizhenia tianjinensis]SFT51044.1 Protein of unknown function [Lishizhenia tianjinensis]